MLKGWKKLSESHKYHYFEDGRSLCLRYKSSRTDFDNVHPTWVESELEDGTIDVKFDPGFCWKCQYYEAFGKSKPPHCPKCDGCGRFATDGVWDDIPHYWGWEERYLCRKCNDETTENRNRHR